MSSSNRTSEVDSPGLCPGRSEFTIDIIPVSQDASATYTLSLRGPAATTSVASPPPEQTALSMFLQGLRHPVSDERAIDDSIRVTLGHEPEGRAAAATTSGEDVAVDGSASVFTISRNVSMAGGGGTFASGGATAHSSVFEVMLPTRNYSALRPPPPPPSPSAARRLTAVVPLTLDRGVANNGLPGGEQLVEDVAGEPYVFRYNIRVTEPPPSSLLATDPQLLEAMNHSIAFGYTPSLLAGPVPPPLQRQETAPDHAPDFDAAGDGTGSREVPLFSSREAHHPHTNPHPLQVTSSDSGGTAGRPSGEKSPDDSPLFSAVQTSGPGHERDMTEGTDSNGTGTNTNKDSGGVRPLEYATATYITTGSFHAQPIMMDDVHRERTIVDCFNSLSSERRRVELLEAFYVAHMLPYESQASFTGDNWDDVLSHEKSTKCFEFAFDKTRYCFYLTIFRRVYRVFIFSFLLRCFCVFLFWVIMFCLVKPNYFYPGGMFFDTLSTILFAGIAGTIAARVLTIPTLIGVIWAGILWNNVPHTGRLTAGITLEMRQFISYFGLSIGLIRVGLSLNVIRFKQKLKHYIVFSILPMAAEAMVHGVCSKAIYRFPNYRWAFAEGFLLSSIAPSVVVPIIIAYQRRGYGVRDGPPMMMLCSIAVDTSICIWAIQFLLALEFQTMSTALLIVLAPVQVIVGLVGGVLLGMAVFAVTFFVLFMEGERLPGVRAGRQMTLRHSVHVRYLSIGFMVLVAFTCMAVGRRFSCVGGAAVGAVTVAGTFNFLCVCGGTRDHLRVKADMAQTLTTVWDYIAMPSLFGLSGAAVNIHELFARDFIGQAFGLVFIGMGVRSLFAMLSPLITRLGLSWQEIVFCGIGWIGKGSVQGAMGGTAQLYAEQELARATTPAEIAVARERVALGIKMKNTAILGILVACPLCSIFLTRFTPNLLKKGT